MRSTPAAAIIVLTALSCEGVLPEPEAPPARDTAAETISPCGQQPSPEARTRCKHQRAPGEANGQLGAVEVRVRPGTPAEAVEIRCPSGYRQRADLVDQRATLSDVPVEDCALFFHGGVLAKYPGVRGGMVAECSIRGTTAVCVTDLSLPVRPDPG